MTFKEFCVAFSSYIYTILYVNLILLNANGNFDIPILDGSNSKYLVKLAKIPGITIFKRESIRGNQNFIGHYTVDSAEAGIDYYPLEPLNYNNLDPKYKGFLHLLRVGMHYNAFYYKSSLTAEQKDSIKQSILTFNYNDITLGQIPKLVRLATFKKFNIRDLDSQINSNILRAEKLVETELSQYTSIFRSSSVASPSTSSSSGTPPVNCDAMKYPLFCKEFATIKQKIKAAIDGSNSFEQQNPVLYREILAAATNVIISPRLVADMLAKDSDDASVICDIFLVYLIHNSTNYSSFEMKLDNIIKFLKEKKPEDELKKTEFWYRIIDHITKSTIDGSKILFFEVIDYYLEEHLKADKKYS
jgi:hypothetical protein